jgi:hypothetical protein
VCSDLEPIGLYKPTGELSIDNENDKVKVGESDSGIDLWFSDADEEGIINVDEIETEERSFKE